MALEPYKFQPGNTAGAKGRPIGARNKLKAGFLDALCASFDKDGPAAIERVMREDPSTYIRVIASLLPKEVTGEDGVPLMTNLTVTFVKPGTET